MTLVFADYQTILIPLSRGRMKVSEKKFMINKFVEVLDLFL